MTRGRNDSQSTPISNIEFAPIPLRLLAYMVDATGLFFVGLFVPGIVIGFFMGRFSPGAAIRVNTSRLRRVHRSTTRRRTPIDMSIEPVPEAKPTEPQERAARPDRGPGGGRDEEALLANRGGRLTGRQARTVTNSVLRYFLVGFGLLVTFIVGVSSRDVARLFGDPVMPFVIGLAALVALVALSPWLWRAFREWRDVRDGRVEAAEGIVTTKTKWVGDNTAENLYVGGVNYRPREGMRRAMTGKVRLFILPRSREPVNFEALSPSHPTPDDPKARYAEMEMNRSNLQCTARDTAGQRCALAADHPGDHMTMAQHAETQKAQEAWPNAGPVAPVAAREGIRGLDWILVSRDERGGLQYLAGLIGLGSAVAVGQLWVLVLSFFLPADSGFGAAYLVVAIPLGLCAFGGVLLARRSRKGSLIGTWAFTFAVSVVVLLMLYAGAG